MAKLYFLTLLFGMFFAQQSFAASPWYGVQSASLAKTCHYFENRARFMARGPNVKLEVILADSCRDAFSRFISRIGTTPYEAKRARAYLDRLTEYKRVVISMNTQGFKKARSHRPVMLGGAPRIKVSQAGEYLIARHMGVISALEDWAKVSKFDLARR